MSKISHDYSKNGVFVSKLPINVGDEVKISYSGLLAENGADRVFAHIGYDEAWKESQYVSMEKEEGLFVTKLKVPNYVKLNVCFKDSASNWDNKGSYYSFPIESKKTKSVVTKPIENVVKGSVDEPVKKTIKRSLKK